MWLDRTRSWLRWVGRVWLGLWGATWWEELTWVHESRMAVAWGRSVAELLHWWSRRMGMLVVLWVGMVESRPWSKVVPRGLVWVALVRATRWA